jgi:ATP-dependent Clp protease ATP-binding subunit ClpA
MVVRSRGDDGWVSVFGSPASSAIALSEDEARMLGRRVVEPEHLLLAIFRRGQVKDLLRHRVSAGDVYALLVDRHGLGDDLTLGRVPRSLRLDGVLAAAMDLAAERGDSQITDVHLLLALAGEPDSDEVLGALGLEGVAAVIDEHFPPQGKSVQDEMTRLQRVRTELGEGHRQIHSIVPAFERFTGDARRAVRAALETASLIEHRNVEPFHLLLGCAQVHRSFAGRTLHPVFENAELGAVGELIDRAMRMGPPTAHQATGIFSDQARRLVAEDAVKYAYRSGDRQISTGHLLLAVLDANDRTTEAMLEPHIQPLARTLVTGLPAVEDGPDEGELSWIQLDSLIRLLTLEFRRVLPPGWTVFAETRGSIHLRKPGAHSEFDFAIRPEWIISEFGSGRERLTRSPAGFLSSSKPR